MRTPSIIIAAALFLAVTAFADGVYVWTDDKGVQHFSDRPPENIENYEKIEDPGSDIQVGGEARPAWQKMLKEVEDQNRQNDLRKAQEAEARREAEERAAQAEKKARTDAERQRLQKQIDELNGRALSPTFTQGMRENLIKEIQKQIDALEE